MVLVAEEEEPPLEEEDLLAHLHRVAVQQPPLIGERPPHRRVYNEMPRRVGDINIELLGPEVRHEGELHGEEEGALRSLGRQHYAEDLPIVALKPDFGRPSSSRPSKGFKREPFLRT